jgi:hypothetical protein
MPLFIEFMFDGLEEPKYMFLDQEVKAVEDADQPIAIDGSSGTVGTCLHRSDLVARGIVS